MENSFFDRMRRLASRHTILTNVGNNQFKTIDLNKVQQTGGLQNNYSSYKGARLFSAIGSNYGGLGVGGSFNQNSMWRQTLYNEYEMMNQDAIISSALDIIASQATVKNFSGKILKISSTDENIKSTLENLFYDVLHIDHNLFSIARGMCHYGDNFRYLKIAENYGIIDWIPMNAYNTTRNENQDTGETTFQYDEYGAGGNVHSLNYFDYEIAHFRLNPDISTYPYGKSFIEGSRKTWKMLMLMEDASLIHRLMRSADKRKIFIDVGGMSPNDIEGYMQKHINATKKTPFIDYSTGDYNLKYNMMNLLEDWYLPKRNKDDQTDIQNISGLTFAGMEDVEYYKQKLFTSLKIPKAFYTEIADLNGTSTLSNLTLNFVPLVERIQQAIVDELVKIAFYHLDIRGIRGADRVNFTLELTSPSVIYQQEKINTFKEMSDLATTMLDNNLASRNHIFKNIYGYSDDEISRMNDEILEDKKQMFRISQIENEGNDPMESGESFGTPHDLATLYNDKTEIASKPNLDKLGNNLDKDVGRPRNHASVIGTDDHLFGRDRFGTDSGFDNTPNKSTFVKSPSPIYESMMNKYDKIRKKVNIYSN